MACVKSIITKILFCLVEFRRIFTRLGKRHRPQKSLFQCSFWRFLPYWQSRHPKRQIQFSMTWRRWKERLQSRVWRAFHRSWVKFFWVHFSAKWWEFNSTPCLQDHKSNSSTQLALEWTQFVSFLQAQSKWPSDWDRSLWDRFWWHHKREWAWSGSLDHKGKSSLFSKVNKVLTTRASTFSKGIGRKVSWNWMCSIMALSAFLGLYLLPERKSITLCSSK